MAAKKGRPPKIAEQRVLEAGSARKGSVSHRPVPTPVVLAPRITPETRALRPPDLPPEANELWDESIEFLSEKNIAQMIDVPALKMMGIHYAMASRAMQVLAEQGFFAPGSKGQMGEHPAVRVFERASARFLAYASEFGLTTLARTRLGLLDVTRRSMESDLNESLGRNPRRPRSEAPAT